jgi:hypothetical protein
VAAVPVPATCVQVAQTAPFVSLSNGERLAGDVVDRLGEAGVERVGPPVSTHWLVPGTRSSRKMCQSPEAASNMSAHQRSSLYQSLLCGWSAVGMVAPLNDWSWYPRSPSAAEAAGGTAATPTTTREDRQEGKQDPASNKHRTHPRAGCPATSRGTAEDALGAAPDTSRNVGDHEAPANPNAGSATQRIRNGRYRSVISLSATETG